MSVTEINDLVKRLEKLYTHLATNRRHLHAIEDRAEDLKNDIMALVPPAPPEPIPEAEPVPDAEEGWDQDEEAPAEAEAEKEPEKG